MSDDYSTPPFSPVARLTDAVHQADSDGPGATKAKSSRRNVSFMPTATIAYLGQSNQTAEDERTVIRVRLGQLAVIYVLLFGMTLVVRPFLLGVMDPVVAAVAGILFTLLLGLALVLSWRPAIPVAALRLLELAVTASLAGLLVLYLYRRLVERSLADDPLTAQLVEKNGVLLLSILILFHGIFVPKSLRPRPGGGRAAGTLVADHGSGQLSGASRRRWAGSAVAAIAASCRRRSSSPSIRCFCCCWRQWRPAAHTCFRACDAN